MFPLIASICKTGMIDSSCSQRFTDAESGRSFNSSIFVYFKTHYLDLYLSNNSVPLGDGYGCFHLLLTYKNEANPSCS